MSAALQPRFSFDDWLAIERTATDQRCEYVAGEVFAMAGGSEEHNLIVANVVRELGNQLKGRPCRVYPSDMKVHIAAADVGVYPDVMVICGEREFHDGRRDVVYYRSLHSLQAYLLLSQERMQAELFLRQPDGTWSLSSYQESSESIPLPVVEAELSLAEVYDKVEWIASDARG